MSEPRINLIEKIYYSLDSERRGRINIDILKTKFSAINHPDVISKRKTEDDVLFEFLESFDDFCQYLAELSPIKEITIDDFIEYYTNLNICIDDDNEFAAILNNVW